MASIKPAPEVYPGVRQGSRLTLPNPGAAQAAVLPPFCVRCNAPSNGKPLTKTLSWHHPALYLVILAGVLIYVIVAIIVRKTMKVQVPLCAQHAQRRSTAVMLSWIMPLIGIADVIVLPRVGVDVAVAVLLMFALVVAGGITWAIVGTPIRPKRIDQYRGIFTGFCEEFLQRFPDGAQLPVAPIATQPLPPPPPIA
jgi:hypothetical protein